MYLRRLVAVAPGIPLGHRDRELSASRHGELVDRAGPPQVALVWAAAAVEGRLPPPSEQLLRPRWREPDADEEHVEVLAEVLKQHPERPVVLGDVVEHPVRSVRVPLPQLLPLRGEVGPPSRPLLPTPRVPDLEETEVAVLLQVDDAVRVPLQDPPVALLMPGLPLADGVAAATKAILLHPELQFLPQEPVLALVPRLRIHQVDQVRVTSCEVLQCVRHRSCLQVPVAPPMHLRVRLLDQHHPNLAHVLAARVQRLPARAAGDPVVDADVLPPAVLVEPDGIDPLRAILRRCEQVP
mmetsp:Transcript_8600/g.28658  ORF Transcript_8600/g.28658 Transcript_8600/m.28658 type:complete len:296 (-) Transcript_8600:579-1466(-)